MQYAAPLAHGLVPNKAATFMYYGHKNTNGQCIII